MRLIAFLTEPSTIRAILAHLGEPTTAPVLTPCARAPPELGANELVGTPGFAFDQSPPWDPTAPPPDPGFSFDQTRHRSPSPRRRVIPPARVPYPYATIPEAGKFLADDGAPASCATRAAVSRTGHEHCRQPHHRTQPPDCRQHLPKACGLAPARQRHRPFETPIPQRPHRSRRGRL